MVCVTEDGDVYPRCLQNVGVTLTRLESRETEVFPTGPQHHYHPRERATSGVRPSAHLNVSHCSQLSVCPGARENLGLRGEEGLEGGRF